LPKDINGVKNNPNLLLDDVTVIDHA